MIYISTWFLLLLAVFLMGPKEFINPMNTASVFVLFEVIISIDISNALTYTCTWKQTPDSLEQ